MLLGVTTGASGTEAEVVAKGHNLGEEAKVQTLQGVHACG